MITGASNGIGRALALAYGEQGADVVLADIDVKGGEDTVQTIVDRGGRGTFVHTDVKMEADIIHLMKQAVDKYGQIDILINNAGKTVFKSPLECTVDEWDDVMNTNVRSAFLSTKEAAKVMKENEDGGVVINMASTRAAMSEANTEAYAASKGGIVALTHAFAVSLAEERIRVNAISPGWIHTGSREDLREVDHIQHLSKRVGKPEDIVKACFYLSDSDNDFVNGENITVDGGMTKKMMYEH